MRCFNHSEVEAVGLCGVCQRGLCTACVVDMERGLACKGRCELELRRIIDLRDFSFAQPMHQAALLKKTSRTYLGSGIFKLVSGGAFVAGDLAFLHTRWIALVGAAFACYGLYSLYLGRDDGERDQFRLCPHCGYNITGNTTDNCPECGKIA